MIQSTVERLPIEIKEEIFQYLSASDLLSLMLVSKCFNESVGQSRKCMDRFWMKFYSFNLKDMDCLTASVRNYEKLKVNRVNREDHFQYLIDLQQHWRKILIYNCEFKHFSAYRSFIESISLWVEELEISDIEILCYDEPSKQEIQFPLLKRVMFRNMPSRALELFLASSVSLENAAFDIPQEVDGALMSLHDVTFEFLKNSKQLKHLHLGPLYIRALFGEEDKDILFDFKLSRLLLKFPIASDLPEYSYAKIANFIKSQSSVQWFIAMELRNDLVLSTAWNELTSAKQIAFFGLEELFDFDMEFNVTESNESIMKLSLISRKILISHLNKLLKSCPLITSIHFKNLNRHMMNAVAKNHFGIKILLYEHIEEDVAEFYEKLKQTDDDVNKDIVLIQRSFWFHDNPFSLDPLFWRKE